MIIYYPLINAIVQKQLRAVFSKCLNAETGEYHIIFLPTMTRTSMSIEWNAKI